MIKTVFERKEKKFLISPEQYNELRMRLSMYTTEDNFGDTFIGNLYYDTPDFLLIRRSIEKPTYKEKLRLRCYGVPESNSIAFIELKKKFKGIVYKRRISCKYSEAIDFLLEGEAPNNDQITRELEYFLKFYNSLAPRASGWYHRLSFIAKDDPSLRITFDDNIKFSFERLDLREGICGEPITDKILMEIKCTNSFPMWLCKILSDMGLYSSSFSKYGTAYSKIAFKGDFYG